MQLRDTRDGYGVVTRVLHWGMGLAIVALFVLGVWMRTLDYMSPYYTLAPDIHRSVGMILLGLLVIRFVWRLAGEKPSDHELSPVEARLAALVHWGFYPLLFAMMVSGYLISSADGRPVDVFGWFQVPSVISYPGLEDTAGTVHMVLAYATIALAAVHTAAALKHHFKDRNSTLTRMWSGPPR